MFLNQVQVLIILQSLQKVSLPIKSTESCYMTDSNGLPFYNGTINVTRSGVECQRWDADLPHKKYNMTSDHANYCRNPDQNELGAWCYILKESIGWNFCDIHKCNITDEIAIEDGENLHSEYGHGAGTMGAALIMVSLAVFIVTGLTVALFLKRTRNAEDEYVNPVTQRMYSRCNSKSQPDIFMRRTRKGILDSDCQWNPSHSFTI